MGAGDPFSQMMADSSGSRREGHDFSSAVERGRVSSQTCLEGCAFLERSACRGADSTADDAESRDDAAGYDGLCALEWVPRILSA